MPKVEFDSDDVFNLALSLVGLVLRDGPMTVSELEKYFQIPRKPILRAARAIGNSEDLYRYESHFYLDEDLLQEEDMIDFSVGQSALEAPPPLSRSQATALATGLEYLASLPQFQGNSDLNELREMLIGAEQPIVYSNTAHPLQTMLEDLRTAITNQVRVAGKYQNQTGEVSWREIEPLRIDFVGKRYYLRGYCLKNNELRSFRLDRLSELEILPDQISEAGRKALIPDEIYGTNPGNYLVELEVEPHAFEIFWNFPTQSEPKQLPSGVFRGTIRLGNPGAIARHVVRYGGAVRVLSPNEAKDAVRAFAERALGEKAVLED